MTDPIEQLLRDTFTEDAARAPGAGGLAAAARRRSTRRRHRAQALGVAVSVAAVVTTASLAPALRPATGTESPATATASPTAASADWRGCDFATVQPTTTRAPDPPRLSASFRPVALVKCEIDFVTASDGSVARTGFERRTDDWTDVDAIAASLRLPNLRYVDGTTCLTVGQLMPSFVLLDAQGRAVRAQVPTDGCGHFRREFRDRYLALDTRVVKTEQLGVVTTAGAARAGCQQRAELTKYLSWPASPAGQGTAPGPFTGDRVATVCVYARTSSDAQQPIGEFVSGRKLGAAARASLVTALEGGGPAGARCDTEASSFALVTDDRDTAVIELDGCREVLVLVYDGARQRTVRLHASSQLVQQLTTGPTG